MGWKEYESEDGKYYYNEETEETTWDKPTELMTPAELAIYHSDWQEFTTDEGEKYWFNKVTEVSSWDIPQEIATILAEKDIGEAEKSDGVGEASQPNEEVAAGESDKADTNKVLDQQSKQEDLASESSLKDIRPEQAALSKSELLNDVPRGGQAFRQMLVDHNVAADGNWESHIASLTSDKRYWTVGDALSREAQYREYAEKVILLQGSTKVREQEEALKDLESILEKAGIHWYTRWFHVKALVFQTTGYDELLEKKAFVSYRSRLKEAHDEEVKRIYDQEFADLKKFVDALDIKAGTPWSEVKYQIGKLVNGYQWVTMSDGLKLFQNAVKDAERQANDLLEGERRAERSYLRKCRREYVGLLQELKSAGKITNRTTWKEIHGLVKDDPRYIELCGLPCSTPVDLAFDMIEQEEQSLKLFRETILDILASRKITLNDNSTAQDLAEAIKGDSKAASITQDQIKTALPFVLRYFAERRDEDRYVKERARKRALAELREDAESGDYPSYTKWEQVRSKFERDDFALLSEQEKKETFEEIVSRSSKAQNERAALVGRKRDFRDMQQEDAVRKVPVLDY